ncbi:hypothetical protein ACFL20_02785 [Spirochaetota bacterium]
MHEGDHGIINETQEEFEAKFGDHSHDHAHDHSHSHDSKDSPPGKEKAVKIIAGLIIAALAAIFVYYKFL